jgi:hypothetical protein
LSGNLGQDLQNKKHHYRHKQDNKEHSPKVSGKKITVTEVEFFEIAKHSVGNRQ